jgi:cytochrome c5
VDGYNFLCFLSLPKKVIMSDQHEEAHTGPVKTPKQFLTVVVLSFVVPIFVIIGLVYFVTSKHKPSATDVNGAQATAAHIQKIGTVQVKDANRAPKKGDEVYNAQCAACHATGAAGAPKLGDNAAWGPRIKTGYAALLNSALKGKNAMAPQGGGEHDDHEIGLAVVYMANAAGAKFPEPAAPAK